MPDDPGYSVNDFDNLNERQRESNGWGFVKEDLKQYDVHMVTEVRLVWSEETPVEMRKVFAEASVVLHHIAEKAILNQLDHDNLMPTEQLDLFYGYGLDGTPTIIRQSDWKKI